jgi:hypothetical protein
VSSSSWRKERNNKLTMQTRSSGSAHLISCVVASKTEDYIRLLMKSDILWKKKKLWKNLEKKSDSYRWNKRRRIEWERKREKRNHLTRIDETTFNTCVVYMRCWYSDGYWVTLISFSFFFFSYWGFENFPKFFIFFICFGVLKINFILVKFNEGSDDRLRVLIRIHDRIRT